jgi:hypothetical protein
VSLFLIVQYKSLYFIFDIPLANIAKIGETMRDEKISLKLYGFAQRKRVLPLKRFFGTKLRQIWIPKEFRLPEPEFTKEQLDLLEELIQMIGPTISRAASAAKDERAKMVDFLVDLGTGIWRVRRKIDGLSRMPKEIRDALYSLESMWMSMSQDGVEIVDHIGTTPSAKEAKVVEVREIPGLTREQVIDAIKPTIILKGEVVQMGEVVVGRPPYAAVRAGDTRAAAPAVPPEPDDEAPVPAHEVETITMSPPLRKWSPDEEKTDGRAPVPDEERPDAPVTPVEDDAARHETSEPLREERESDVKPNAENADGLTSDPETAAIAEAEEGQNTVAKEAPREEAQSAEEVIAEPPSPVKARRRRVSAKTASNTMPDAPPEKDETPDKKTAGRKVRTSAARKPRKKTAAPPEDTDIAPKEEA